MTIEPVLVGRYPTPEGRFEGQELLPTSQRELRALAWFWQDILETFGLKAGDGVLLTASLDKAAQLYPFELAAADLNLVVYSAEPTFFDAGRVESIIRRLAPRVLVGATAEMLEGLRANGHQAARLLNGMTVFAWPSAYEEVDAIIGVTARRLAEVGPVVAVECAKGAGLHYDGREWNLRDEGEALAVSSRLPRALDFDCVATGVAGQLDRTPCACGLTQPRVQFAAAR